MTDSDTQSEYWDPRHNDLSEGGVSVAEFQTEEECNFASYLLSEEGVRSAVIVRERRLDLRLSQLRVAPDDEALARRILAQPITAEKRLQYDAELECEPFVSPRCPVCASSEVILESVANGNLWQCDICGKSWLDALVVTQG